MNAFTASNGMNVSRDSNEDVVIGAGTDAISVFMKDGTALALREFFRAEEDERLGRWRWPKDPDYVVYSEWGGLHVVLRESTGESEKRNGLYVHDMEGEAARDYRDAHPEPKPWFDAKDGELWVLTIDGKEDVYVIVRDEGAGPRMFSARSTIYRPGAFPSEVTEGRRIWPEVSP